MLSILSQKHGSPIGCIPQPTTIASSSNWVDSSKSTRVGRIKTAIVESMLQEDLLRDKNRY